MKNVTKVKGATIEYGNQKILYIKFHCKENIDIEAAKQIIAASTALTGTEIHCNFVDSTELLFMTNEARNYFGQQDKSTVLAIAVLIKSKIQESIGNFYLKFSRPKIPTKLFTNEEEAHQWLKTELAKVIL